MINIVAVKQLYYNGFFERRIIVREVTKTI